MFDLSFWASDDFYPRYNTQSDTLEGVLESLAIFLSQSLPGIDTMPKPDNEQHRVLAIIDELQQLKMCESNKTITGEVFDL